MEKKEREIPEIEFTSRGNFWGWREVNGRNEPVFKLSLDSIHMLNRWNVALAKRQSQQAA